MSVDVIISRIREEAEKEVQAVRAEEASVLTSIRSKAQQKAEDIYNRRVAEGMREIRQNSASHQSKARIEAKRKVREVKEELIRECFSEVSGYLNTIRGRPEYPVLLKNLLLECAQNLGSSKVRVQVHSDDRLLAEDLIQAINLEGFSLHLSDAVIQTAGGVVCERVSDKIIIDNTVETRSARMKREMIVAASETLLQNGEP